MSFVGRGVFRLAGLVMLAMAVPACAQDNLDRGKSAQQLFASDCAICHRSPQGLAKGGGGLFGLQGFLREHYTASRETAAVLARYLEEAGAAPVVDQKKQPRRTTKPAEAKPSDTKPSDNKAADKPETKPEVAKTEAKPDVKPEAKPEAKSEPKPEPKPEPKESAGTEIKSGIAVSPAPADKPKSE